MFAARRKTFSLRTVAGGLLSERYLNKPEPDTTTWSQMKYAHFIKETGGWEVFQSLLQTLKKLAQKHGVSILKWGDPLIPLFTLAIFITLSHKLRLERLRKRECERYGSRIEVGGDMYSSGQEFLEWASSYDTAGLETRSLSSHQAWLKTLTCPVIQLGSTEAVEVLLAKVWPHLNHAVK